MTVPDFQTIMLPLLRTITDQREYSIRDVIENLAKEFNLTEQDRKELLPSGQQYVFDNRVGWARTYLKKAGLLDSPKRGFIKISPQGLEVLKKEPNKINVAFLKQYPAFVEFQFSKRSENAEQQSKYLSSDKDVTPLESLEEGYNTITKNLVSELLAQIKECSPEFFEKLVVELLVKMGYGGSIRDAGKAVGKSGDGGIDGIIKEDKLGLDIIYVQAKRWENSVGRPQIMAFVGALQGQRARKGIFITTSYFTKEAVDYVKNIDTKVILVDGEMLASYMIDYNIGVSKVASYEIKKIDSDYFLEE